MEEQLQGWDKWKVFILGLLSAVIVVFEPYLLLGQEIVWPQIGLAAGMIALSYIANSWRGQGETIFGLISVVAAVVVSQLENSSVPFTWERTLIGVGYALVLAISGPIKSRGYENTPMIKQAKAEGELIAPAALTNAEVKKEAQSLKQTDQIKKL